MPKYLAIGLVVLLAAGLTAGCATAVQSDDASPAAEAASDDLASPSAQKPEVDTPPTIDIHFEVHRGGKLVSKPRIVTLSGQEITVSSTSNDAKGKIEHQVELVLTPVLGDRGLVAFDGRFQGSVRGTVAAEQEVSLMTPLGGTASVELSLDGIDYTITLAPVMDEGP